MDDTRTDMRQVRLRAEALESLLVERGLLMESDIDHVIAQFEQRVGPVNGAKVVARAWTDAEFKLRLLADGTDAIREFRFSGGQVERLVVVENTHAEHNVVVCTLCSCYPWALLGLPPRWYKDPAYRSRIVREPRSVLAEMGLEVPESKRIRVWDSSAEIRYMVLPQRPDGAETLSEKEREALVTRDAMIGVA